ncbi:MAG: glutamate--tRNA ligase [Acidobacteria bacterium]|nr:glutamate--tRNA ligase [Acidobacteriota bacterium]
MSPEPTGKTALEGPVRVRFAPSPTGFLHVGGARTAIYNDLLRQSLGGTFVLRIEDTDRERSNQAMIEQICQGLEWIGVEWDEGPLLQSDGVERHREAARRLVEAGQAYYCFRTPEELDEARQAAEKRGVIFRYREVFEPPSPAEAERRRAAGEPCAVRFRMPEEDIRIVDLVRGEVAFPAESLDDFIILRSDGSPTYHLSVVCDDIEMAATHVVRGEDHLSNTPKHVGLFRALGAPVPTFGHLPLILGSDRKRLSKRTGATSVEEFRDQGLLPQALYNALALLGWSPGDDLEVMPREEMIARFTVERLNAAAAVFDRDKLAWINGQYMSGLPLEELLPHLEPFLEEVGLGGLEGASRERLAVVADLLRTRAHTLRELAAFAVAYFKERVAYDPEECAKFLGQDDLPAQLERLAARFGALEAFEVEGLERELRALAEEVGVKAGVLIHPTRMALTGSKAGPSLFDVVAVMGREATLRHLTNFAAFLRSAGT